MFSFHRPYRPEFFVHELHAPIPPWQVIGLKEEIEKNGVSIYSLFTKCAKPFNIAFNLTYPKPNALKLFFCTSASNLFLFNDNASSCVAYNARSFFNNIHWMKCHQCKYSGNNRH